MELSHAQKMELYEDGYTVIRGAVPQALVERAMRAINHSVGEGLPREEIQILRSRSYCKELKETPLISDLVNKTPVLELAESVIGKGQLKPVRGGQVALRFPIMKDPPPKPSGHLDGMTSKYNGVPDDGRFHNFTMLAVVLLSRLDAPYSGNFTVWPGTHRLFEQYFREHGPESLLREGMPKVDYPEAVQITGAPGDVVLAHYQLAHGAAPNCSAHVRYASIYRLNHVRRSAPGYADVLTDLWREWPGIRGIAPRPETASAPLETARQT